MQLSSLDALYMVTHFQVDPAALVLVLGILCQIRIKRPEKTLGDIVQ